ncbi:MAG: di-trans,poly-cis-decaprenylcistransferase [Proteobacteria bacterium]|nr:di-trans,poly-cis-decaprenylcistransferase [Pseudomonadota bacterium]
MQKPHVGIIMDGNGRWAQRRGLPRTAGHVEGAKAVNEIVETAARAHVRVLTLYAFSSDNWRRPGAEVTALMGLLRRYLTTETRRCIEQSIRINFIGRRDRLTPSLVRAIEQSEQLTAGCAGMHLRIAVDYSAQHSILEAARLAGMETGVDAARFQELLDQVDHSGAAAGAVDLLIRTGAERRLSDFLLWQSAYAELYFADCMWPDFDAAGFHAALDYYHGRQRRFGQVMAEAAT